MPEESKLSVLLGQLTQQAMELSEISERYHKFKALYDEQVEGTAACELKCFAAGEFIGDVKYDALSPNPGAADVIMGLLAERLTAEGLHIVQLWKQLHATTQAGVAQCEAAAAVQAAS